MVEYSKKQASEPEPDPELREDPDRSTYRPVTNIKVRARKVDGSMGPVDLASLDARSLKRWLGEDPARAARTVLVLLRHPLDDGG
jgi:hypothetical protein